MEEKYFESNKITMINSQGSWRKELVMIQSEMITTMETLGSADINISTDAKNTFELGRGWASDNAGMK